MSHQSPASTTNNTMLITRKKRRGLIEKKRRDKINSSLGELRRLVPAAFEKQGSSKLEKAEILQMTVDYLRLLHANGLADILISKSKQLEQLTPNTPAHHSHHHSHQQQQQQATQATQPVLDPSAAAAAAAAAAAVVASSNQQQHQVASLGGHHHHHQNASVVPAGYPCQPHATAAAAAVSNLKLGRYSPPTSSDQFSSSSQDNTSITTATGNNNNNSSQHHSLDQSAASYQHPRALYQYQAPATSGIYPAYQEHHLPRYYYS